MRIITVTEFETDEIDGTVEVSSSVSYGDEYSFLRSVGAVGLSMALTEKSDKELNHDVVISSFRKCGFVPVEEKKFLDKATDLLDKVNVTSIKAYGGHTVIDYKDLIKSSYYLDQLTDRGGDLKLLLEISLNSLQSIDKEAYNKINNAIKKHKELNENRKKKSKSKEVEKAKRILEKHGIKVLSNQG